MNKTALFLSVALTVIVVISVGAVVWSLRQPLVTDGSALAAPALEGDSATAEPSDSSVTATLDPQLEKIWMEREAAYQQRIAEANARLGQLQQQLAQETTAPTDAAQSATITPEQAAAIAADYLGTTSVYSVNLVVLGGGNVYEVTMPAGDIVYVSLDGRIVGSVAAPVFSSGGGGGGHGGVGIDNGSGSGGDDDHGDGHEDHDDDHDDDHEGEHDD